MIAAHVIHDSAICFIAKCHSKLEFSRSSNEKCHESDDIKPPNRMMMQISWLQCLSHDEFFLARSLACVYKHVIVNEILNLGIIEGIQE